MTLTPLDIEKLELRTGFRGYNREDVERFRYEVLRTVEDYLARIAALQARVGELERDLQQYHANEELLKSSVVLAQKTSDELIAAARQRAELIVREAGAEGEDIRRRLSDIRNEREQFEYAFHGLLSGFLHRLEQGNPSLKPGSVAAPAALGSGIQAKLEQDTSTATNQMVDNTETLGGKVREGIEAGAVGSAPVLSFTESVKQSEPVSEPQAAQPGFGSTRPVAPAMPSRSAGDAAPANERDADIGNFAAVLDSAKVTPGPPRVSEREHGMPVAAQQEQLADHSSPEIASATFPRFGMANAPPANPRETADEPTGPLADDAVEPDGE